MEEKKFFPRSLYRLKTIKNGRVKYNNEQINKNILYCQNILYIIILREKFNTKAYST